MHRGAVAGIAQRLPQCPRRRIHHEQVVHVFNIDGRAVRRERQVHRPAAELELVAGGMKNLLRWDGLLSVRQLANLNVRLGLRHPVETPEAGGGSGEAGVAAQRAHGLPCGGREIGGVLHLKLAAGTTPLQGQLRRVD